MLQLLLWAGICFVNTGLSAKEAEKTMPKAKYVVYIYNQAVPAAFSCQHIVGLTVIDHRIGAGAGDDRE